MRVSNIVFVAALLSLPLAAQQAFTSSDDMVRVTAPESWTVMELNDSAELEIGNEEDGAYFIVLNELKEDLYGWNIEKHSRVTFGGLLQNLAFPEIKGPKSMTIGGHPAVQYEVVAANGELRIHYIHTTIETDRLFSQILAWTVPSKTTKNRPALEKAILSWREN